MNNYNNNNYDNVYDGAFQQNKNLQRMNEINRNQINDRFTPNRNLQNYFLSNQTPNDNNFKDYNNMGFNQKSYLNSPYSRYDNIKDFFSNNLTVNNTNNIFNNINFPYLNQNNIQNSNLRAIQILRSLISKNKTLKLLMPSKPINFNNDYNNNNIPRELCDANCNYNLWVEKFKKYLSTKLLEDLLFQHNNNLFTLNQLLEFTGIQVLSIIPEVEPGNFYEILQEQLEENFINNLNINNNNNSNFKNYNHNYNNLNNINNNMFRSSSFDKKIFYRTNNNNINNYYNNKSIYNNKNNYNYNNNNIKYISNNNIRKITFHIIYNTIFGEEVGILGNLNIFGNWKKDKIFYLKWHEGNKWIGSINYNDFNIKEVFEYKFVISYHKNVKKWESGENNKIDLIKLYQDLIKNKKGKFNKFKYEYNDKSQELLIYCKWI